MLRRVLIGLGVMALAACASSPPLQTAGEGPEGTQLRVVSGSELPAPQRTDLTHGDRPYYVGPYDTLLVDVFGIEELKEREVQVDTSGRISFPLAGSLAVAGQTPAEIEDLLRRRLTEAYVRNPRVTVNLKTIVSQVVTIEGQVKRPGQFPVSGRMTLLRAIAQAEGTTEFSKLSDVVVFRTVEGQNMAALYDLRAIRRGAYADPEVFANDVVVVGDDKGRRLFRDFLGVLPTLTSPLVVLLQG